MSLLSPTPALAAAIIMLIVPCATCATFIAIAVAHIIALTPNDAKEYNTTATREVGYPLFDNQSWQFGESIGQSGRHVWNSNTHHWPTAHDCALCTQTSSTGGGSNHLFVPTGLLFDWFEHAPLDTNMGNVFGGGLVRVD